MKTFVLKVQLSLVTTAGASQVLAYNRDRSVYWHAAASPDVIAIMRGRSRAFFEATRNVQGVVEIGHEVPEQDW